MRFIGLAVLQGIIVLGDNPQDHRVKEKERIQGTWLVVSGVAGGEPIDVWQLDSKRWEFKNGRFRGWAGSKEEWVGSFELDPPTNLDLIPAAGKDRTPRKCLYSLTDDRLRIAITYWFAPSTPELEAEDIKIMKSTRPKSLDKTKGEAVIVYTLKRVKAEK